MRVLQINALYSSGSTGFIVKKISETVDDNKGLSFVAHSFGKKEKNKKIQRFSNKFLIKVNSLLAHFFGNYGFEDIVGTKQLIRIIKTTKPDIVHFHNIHSHDVNIDILFKYLNKTNIKIIWTFHDCWAFTGYCTHFDYIQCNKWKTSCHNCPIKREFSFFFDQSNNLFKKKRDILLRSNFTIVVPSFWLQSVVAQSCLSNKPIRVINNGIDLSIFKPMNCNDFETQSQKKIILFVAYKFTERKGIKDIIYISDNIDHSKYLIMLIGSVPKRYLQLLNQNIIHIDKTNDRKELARYYSEAYVFVNTTYEDTFPTVNIESIACGTPIITYDTGGSSEIVSKNVGFVVKKGNMDAILKLINENAVDTIKRSDCVQESKKYDQNNKFYEYYKLYEEVLKQ